MSSAANTELERRIYPRIAINGQVKYKLESTADYNDGLIIDISQTGVLVKLEQQLAVDTLIFLLMEADEENESAIEITTEVVRIIDADESGLYCYGCMILDVNDL